MISLGSRVKLLHTNSLITADTFWHWRLVWKTVTVFCNVKFQSEVRSMTHPGNEYMGMSQIRNAPSSLFLVKKKGLGHSHIQTGSGICFTKHGFQFKMRHTPHQRRSCPNDPGGWVQSGQLHDPTRSQDSVGEHVWAFNLRGGMQWLKMMVTIQIENNPYLVNLHKKGWWKPQSAVTQDIPRP